MFDYCLCEHLIVHIVCWIYFTSCCHNTLIIRGNCVFEKVVLMKYNDKISYFPDGYRKSNVDVVSPRALKHVQELETIATTTDKRAILCFVIQRTDIKQFQPSNIDLTYKAAVQKAWLNGVEIKTIVAKWTPQGKCYFVRNDLPICLFEEEGPRLEGNSSHLISSS